MARIEPLLALEGVTVAFGDVVALSDVSFEIAAGQIVSLVGPSGSGKSTLLRVIAGLVPPSRGRVRIAGEEVASADCFVEPEQRRVGLVFQDYALFPHLTIEANVAFGLRHRDRGAAHATAAALLDRFGLSRYARSYPHMLSGGERQRVALARALAPQPRVLLMDEPFSGLDGRLRDRIRVETLQVLRETQTTTMMVTHDPTEAMRAADRLALLRAGRLVQIGSVEHVYEHPVTSFAARFLSDVNEVAGTCRGGRVETALGTFEAPHVAEAERVRVCIRPHHLRVSDGPTGVRARVLSSEFLGETDRMTLEVAGLDEPLYLRTSAHVRVAPGQTVSVEVEPAGVLVLADDGK